MKEIVINVPRFLTIKNTLALVTSIYNEPKADVYVFDFGNVYSIEPFSITFLGYNIRNFHKLNNPCKIFCRNYLHMQYAGHMGFFKSFGLNYGKMPGEATGSSTYLPLTILKTEEIRNEAAINNLAIGDLFTSRAKSMSNILCRSDTGDLYDTIAYCMREILRNVLEHSESDKLAYCAQYWKTLGKVSLCILDLGKGLRNALSANPYLKLDNDLDSIYTALKPGISGKVFKGKKIDYDDPWINSGYGLYMTSNICKNVGSFLIMSGSKCLYLTDKREVVYDCNFEGTAINITLNINSLKSLKLTLGELRDNIGIVKTVPSTSSMKL